MRIRPLEPEDYDALIALWRAAGLPHRPAGRDCREAILAEMALDTAIFLKAEDDSGLLVGAVLGTHDGRKGWINRLAVRPEQRRRGIGRALVEAVWDRLQRRGIHIVAGLVEGHNPASEGLLAALGFERHPDIAYWSRRTGPEV